MLRCDICNKGSQIGHNVSHSKRRTIKKFLPNLHKVTFTIQGKRITQKLCSSCLSKEKDRIMKHELRIRKEEEVSS